MEYLLGTIVVVGVLAFVVLPLLRRQQPTPDDQHTIDPTNERTEIYRELLELELDQKVGKIAEADYQEISDAMLARAATLISQEDADSLASDAQLEREIAEARAALKRTDAPAVGPRPTEAPPAEETRA